MGYKSDIRIRLKATDFKKLVEKYQTELLDKGYNLFSDSKIDFNKAVEEIVEDCVNCDKIRYEKDWDFSMPTEENGKWQDCKEDCVYFGWDSLKWYDGYDEVDLIMGFIQECECYAYARIGEDYNDIEIRQENFDSIFVYSGFSDDEWN